MINIVYFIAGFNSALLCRGWAFVPIGMTDAQKDAWMSGFLRAAMSRTPLVQPKLEPIVAAAIAGKKGVGA